jgi:hypothetical protein
MSPASTCRRRHVPRSSTARKTGSAESDKGRPFPRSVVCFGCPPIFNACSVGMDRQPSGGGRGPGRHRVTAVRLSTASGSLIGFPKGCHQLRRSTVCGGRRRPRSAPPAPSCRVRLRSGLSNKRRGGRVSAGVRWSKPPVVSRLAEKFPDGSLVGDHQEGALLCSRAQQRSGTDDGAPGFPSVFSRSRLASVTA